MRIIRSALLAVAMVLAAAGERSGTPARHRSWRLRFEGEGYAVPSQLRPVS